MRRLLPSLVFALVLPSLALAALLAPSPAVPALRAQAEPPVAASAEERLLFVPNLGELPLGSVVESIWCWLLPNRPPQCEREPVDGSHTDFWRHAVQAGGLRVQNAGAGPTRFMAVYFADLQGEAGPPAGPDTGGCADCGFAGAVCSAAVAPGGDWHFPLRTTAAISATTEISRAWASSAVVYSLNERPARDYDPAWEDWLIERDLDPATSLAAIACAGLGAEGPEVPPVPPPVSACDRYRAFHRAFQTGEAPPGYAGLAFAPFRGEPAAAVARVPMPTTGALGELDFRRPALDRYSAVPLAEAGSLPPAEAIPAPQRPPSYTYWAPGTYLTTPEGQAGIVAIQNAGDACATVRVEAFRTNRGSAGEPVTLTLPAGGRRLLHPGQHWPAPGSAALRLSADQPLAAAITTAGAGTSATHTASRARPGPLAWAVPRAWQPPRPLPLAGEVPASPAGDTALGLDANEGWETNVSIFNPTDIPELVQMDTQAPGEPPRSASYPMDAERQVVLQLGLGLALTGGGAGWGRLSSPPAVPMAVALETIRLALDAPVATEVWTAPAWPFMPGAAEPGPRAVVLPDLGGPAIGGMAPGRIITRTAAMTDALVARIAIQSLYTGTTRVAIDSYAPSCGYAGTVERTIDRYQAIVVPAEELAGTPWGADSAVVRVLQGEAAVLAEVVRPDRAALSTAPVDLSSAMLGTGLAGAELPAKPRAHLRAEPAAIEIALDAATGVHRLTLRLDDALASGRCLSYAASGDTDWLAVDPATGRLPTELTVLVDAERLPPGRIHHGRVDVKVQEAGVDGSPLAIPVTVTVGAEAGGRVYLPSLRREEE